MFASVYSLLNKHTAIKEELGDPLRVYSFNEAPPDPPTPYVVWQYIGGNPYNHLFERPTTDLESIQIDVYASDGVIAKRVTKLVILAIEGLHYVTSYHGSMTDPDTGLARVSFDVEMHSYRDE